MKQINLMTLIALTFLSILTIPFAEILYHFKYLEETLIVLGFGVFGFIIIFVQIYNHKKGIIKL